MKSSGDTQESGPSTLSVNRGYDRNRILPWFEGRPIGDITAHDVRYWFASLHDIPVAADRSAPILSVIMPRRSAKHPVASRLPHLVTSASMTLRYANVGDREIDAVAERIGVAIVWKVSARR